MKHLRFDKLVAVKPMLIASGIYCIHKILCHTSAAYNTSLVRWYMADVLALIVCIPIFVNSQILLGLRRSRAVTIAEASAYSVLFAVYFEILGPMFLHNFTRDFGDIIAYFAGAYLLYALQKY